MKISIPSKSKDSDAEEGDNADAGLAIDLCRDSGTGYESDPHEMRCPYTSVGLT